jgi:hypothetical protein
MRVCLLAAVCLLAVSALVSTAQETPTQKAATHVVKVSLEGLLADLGSKYDRYFTIEDVTGQGELALRSYHSDRKCPITGKCETTSPSAKDLAEELDAIAQGNPNFRYKIDNNNPKIVHIIDNRLAARSDYPMERTLATVQFEGTPWDLVKYLHQRGIALNYMANSLGLESAVDVQTKITINVPSATVRGILSDFIVLDAKRSRILWVSQAELSPGTVMDIWYPLMIGRNP